MNSDSESDWDSMSEAPNPPKQSAVHHKASNGFKQNGHAHQEENGRLDSHLRHELDNGLKAMPFKRTLETGERKEALQVITKYPPPIKKENRSSKKQKRIFTNREYEKSPISSIKGHAVQEKREEHHQQKKDDFIENTAPKHSKRILKSEPELQGNPAKESNMARQKLRSKLVKSDSVHTDETLATIKEGVETPTRKIQEEVIDSGLINPSFEEDTAEESTFQPEDEDRIHFDFQSKAVDFQECPTLMHFQKLETNSFQIYFQKDGALADNLIAPMTMCCQRTLAELIGIIKIPFILIFIILGKEKYQHLKIFLTF
ncbi:uncharacterized protein LOC111711061 [Eurytemora carolleeae]|uniref:uncharacterized protein LOC111711061 n=1 Tax=Eurytemora carolleeae TaxID=1294199 RepID=UPI000C77098E|nr:uncharacterized protein LOC111711061 [Eurytemora carolleeae]|eukprot:XP_023341073.1 uncharacterized protein LOC111711061 [Eurytemora affinis]